MDWTEPTAWAVTGIALAGVHLNNNRRRACFVLWWFSNAASFAIHYHAGMTGLAARDAAFFGLSIVGFIMWRNADPPKRKPGPLRWWTSGWPADKGKRP